LHGIVRTIAIHYDDGAEFLRVFQNDLPGGGLFVPTTEAFEIDEEIALELSFPRITEGLLICGKVKWRRFPTKWRTALPAGIGVSFGSTERSRVEFLIDFCKGALDSLRKPGRRVPVDFRSKILSNGKCLVGRTRDLSRGGAFILTDTPMKKNTAVELDLFIDEASGPERFSGSVVWCRAQGKDPGVGVKFDFGSAIRRRRISRLVGEVEDSLVPPPPPSIRKPVRV
jgi:type IV pilus assembly protein PilZ